MGWVRIRKQLSNIPQARSSQQGIGHGMQQNIGITMPHKLAIVRNVDAAQAQRSPAPKAMCVVSDSNA
jgi:hypothetical protein